MPARGRSTPMSYAEFAPNEALAPYVAAYWRFRVAANAGQILHNVPLTGGFLLSVALKDGFTILVGPRTSPLRFVVRSRDAFWGVHFWPGAGTALMRVGAADLREKEVPASDVCGAEWTARLAASLRIARGDAQAIAALNAALSDRLPALVLDDRVMAAVLRIVAAGGVESVSDVARSVDLSPRHLRRRFVAATGLSPKELALLQRVRASAVDAVTTAQVRWTSIAAKRGFADQPHLVHDFRRLVGLTPASFLHHARRILHGEIRTAGKRTIPPDRSR